MTQGKWINWKDFGFFRETKSSIGKIENTRDPLNPDYPNQPPSFREWTKQNYTGAWASSDKHNNCNLLKFRRTDIQSCFSDSERIVVLGDSRSRHIFRTLSFILQGIDDKNGVWFDTKTTEETKFENTPWLKFVWSGSFDSSFFQNLNYKGKFKEPISKLAQSQWCQAWKDAQKLFHRSKYSENIKIHNFVQNSS